MSGFQLDRYIERDSPIHDADGRLKFVLVIGFILSVSLLPIGSFLALGLAWVVLVVFAMVARLGPLRLSRGAFFALPFLFAALPLVVTKQGHPLGELDLGPFSLVFSGEGLRMFATIALKSWVSVQAALLLSFTTRFPDLIEALRRLHVPALMVAVISFMYRYLAVLVDEGTRMLRARSARSASIEGRRGGSVVWRAKVTGSMVGALFLRAYERSERIYAAMLSRGFTGEMRFIAGRPFRTAEWVTLVAGGVALISFEFAGHLWLPRYA